MKLKALRPLPSNSELSTVSARETVADPCICGGQFGDVSTDCTLSFELCLSDIIENILDGVDRDKLNSNVREEKNTYLEMHSCLHIYRGNKHKERKGERERDRETEREGGGGMKRDSLEKK